MDEQAIKREMIGLYAENMAQQTILTQLLLQMNARPELRPLVEKAFDNAANVAEHFSIARGRQAGHMPETLRIIEQSRVGATGHHKPKHGV
jgi:hypothetical protein